MPQLHELQEKPRRYKEQEGDLIKQALYFDLIGHGANCHNTMGAGIAKQVKQTFPDAFEADKLFHKQVIANQLMLGGYSLGIHNGLGVLNIYSQFNLGANFDKKALRASLKSINERFKGKSIGLPQIGCGIGGGNWKEVRQIIQEELKDMFVTVIIYKPS